MNFGPLARALGWSLAVIALLGISKPQPVKPLDGNAILRKESQLPLPRTYSVPLTFKVHLRRPIGMRARAAATLYFRAPDREALVITSVPGFIGRWISHSYSHIETVPQA